MIRAVIFDLGGVIVRFTNDPYYSHLAEISNKGHEFVKAAIEKKELPLLESGRVNLEYFEANVARRLGIRNNEVDWFQFYKRTVKLNHDMLELVDILHKDYITAFLTNIDKSRYFYTTRILEMDLFDYRFQSCYIGERKPGLGIFRHALKKIGVLPEQAVFIDDRLENVQGAARAGINAVHFKNRRLLDVKLANMGL